MQWRITLGVGLGLLLLFGGFSFIGFRTINATTEAALQERLSVAQMTAHAVDDLIRHAAVQLESAASRPTFGEGTVAERSLLLELLFHPIGTFTRILLLSPQGDILAVEPYTTPGDFEKRDLLGYPGVVEAIRSGTPTILRMPGPTPEHPSIAVIVAPIVREGGANGGALMGELHLSHLGTELVPLPRSNPTTASAVVDENGMILVSNMTPGREAAPKEQHTDLLRPLLTRGEAGTVIHHPRKGLSHVVAFAPLGSMRGGVTVEDSQDVVLAVPRELQKTMLVFGSLALVLATLVAWLDVRRTVRPLHALADASSRIARGSLEERIQVNRTDEIGLLAERFEAMRQQLLAARERQIQWEQELEARVLERTQQVHLLLNKVISAQEEERKRIARELHDEAAQDLAALMVSLRALGKSLPRANARAKDMLERASARLERTLQELRNMMLDLRPSALDDLGLAAAVRWYAEHRTEGTGIKVDFQATGELVPIDVARETAVFRILQEAISNAVKHSACHQVRVRLEFGRKALVGTVEDDGQGFDVLQAEGDSTSGKGLGLVGMRERAALIDGQVHIQSEPGHGTRVHITIPHSEATPDE